MTSTDAVTVNGGGQGPASSDVDIIESLDRAECIFRWTRLFGHRPPKHVSLRFMRRALAYEEQVRRFGGHSKAVRGALEAALKTNGQGRQHSSPRLSVMQLRPGTHLVREWNGRTYQVEVVEEGLRMDGREYRSLSAVARKITGAHWSGPRFFGVG
jgi:hypothetical protein